MRPALPCPDDPNDTMTDIIFTMQDLRKRVPSNREVLKGIWLSFFWGVKIFS